MKSEEIAMVLASGRRWFLVWSIGDGGGTMRFMWNWRADVFSDTRWWRLGWLTLAIIDRGN